jgi:hypothetical protein
VYNAQTEPLFPPRTIPALGEERSAAWRDLVTGVVTAGTDSLEEMAFILVMARLCNCTTCTADSYRAMNGCTACARQSLKRFHDADEELVGLFQSAKTEVEQYLKTSA